MTLPLFDRASLFALLRERGLSEWADVLKRQCADAFSPNRHGTLEQWIDAWSRLPDPSGWTVDAAGDAVAILRVGHEDASETLPSSLPERPEVLRETLMRFHPWRKGPFEFLGIPIDTEWRSDLKWKRLASTIDLAGHLILDVGCGNGYYGWKMLAAGARAVIGLDPFLLYVMQFEAVRRYAGTNCRHWVLPLCDTDLPQNLHAFDTVFSMGVLYHRTSPIGHLQTLWNALRPRGQLALETLIIEGDDHCILVPEGRYAKMRNVWFIPSIPMLQRWLQRTGFCDVRVIDVSPTTEAEQRRTDWMTFESLRDFLCPDDPSKTVEGDPAPVRAILTARRS